MKNEESKGEGFWVETIINNPLHLWERVRVRGIRGTI
jgi:hypothetical protein